MTQALFEHDKDAIDLARLRQRVQALSSRRFLDLMSMDKKVADGQLSLILLQGALGSSVITNKFDVAKLQGVVDDYCVSK